MPGRSARYRDWRRRRYGQHPGPVGTCGQRLPRIGDSCLQGPHQVAHRSTIRQPGWTVLMTSASNALASRDVDDRRSTGRWLIGAPASGAAGRGAGQAFWAAARWASARLSGCEIHCPDIATAAAACCRQVAESPVQCVTPLVPGAGATTPRTQRRRPGDHRHCQRTPDNPTAPPRTR